MTLLVLLHSIFIHVTHKVAFIHSTTCQIQFVHYGLAQKLYGRLFQFNVLRKVKVADFAFTEVYLVLLVFLPGHNFVTAQIHGLQKVLLIDPIGNLCELVLR